MQKILILFLFSFSFLYVRAEGKPAHSGTVNGKMYFSNKPFTNSNAGSKTSFNSKEFIYARLELDNQTLKDAFRLPEDGKSTMKNGKDCFLQYSVTVARGDHETYWENDLNFIYVWGNEKNNNFFNFDVLPKPAEVKSIVSLVEEFDEGYVGSPLYRNITPEHFPENGEYTIRVRLYLKSYDDWGKMEETEKWPMIEEEFKFTFDTRDAGAIRKNWDDATEAVKLVVNKVDKVPDCFAHPAAISDPNASIAKASGIIRTYLSDYTIVKITAAPYTGPLWETVKNDLGLILYRYVVPYYRIIYKENGRCILGSVQLIQDYIGGGKYGPTKFNKFWGDEGVLDCVLVK